MKASPAALAFASDFCEAGPPTAMSCGWLLGEPDKSILAHVPVVAARGSVLPETNVADDLAALLPLLPAGIAVTGFYATHSEASPAQLREHRDRTVAAAAACGVRGRLASGYLGCKEAFAAREAASAVEWLEEAVAADGACGKRFQASHVAVVMRGRRGQHGMIRTGEKTQSVAQVKAATVASLLGGPSKGGVGMDFSRTLTCFVKHVVEEGAACPQMTSAAAIEGPPGEVHVAVGYFAPSESMATVLEQLEHRLATSAVYVEPAAGVPFVLPRRGLLATVLPRQQSVSALQVWEKPPLRLVNVHEHVAEQHGLKEAKVSLVRGYYEYCHYMQDRFNDDGWGCAYRSLQTLCSWMRLQGLNARPVPSHGEIQAALAELGEAVGPKQWIGAVELAMVLHHWYAMDSRIINVASGPEIAAKTDELHRHFATEGSPIMIGGGVLAWTLLGVATAAGRGETKYLILDPHYTGSDDDVKTVCKKGWVAWQPVSVFRKDSFYNLCCPLASRK